MVKEFADSEGTGRYADRVAQDIGVIMGELPDDMYELCLISQGNYQKLLQEKEFIPYLLFHRKFYLGE